MNAEPYHRLQPRRGRAIAELILSIGFTFVAMILVIAVAFRIAGVKKLKDLDQLSKLALDLLSLAPMLLTCRWAARIGKRAPGTLSSVTGRLRWSWLARCVLRALVLELILLSPVIAVLATGHGKKLAWVGWNEFAPVAALIVLLVPLQASAEEYFFRGTVQQVLGSFVRWKWIPIVVSAAAFAAIHLAPLQATVSLFALGGYSAWLTIYTGGLEAAIAWHVLNNLGVLLVNSAGKATTDAIKINQGASWTGVIVQVLLGLVYTGLIIRAFRRRPPTQP
jgi:membrane protease YdiL (CAAX protease family)